ncbi:MAG: tRNA pseudouridine(38-40) synthase TruA [Chloroflexi bacterium]|nr:tRNA pseudouridine(38-40) synthase TruA [Chloroflexota bacterium]
MRKLKLEMEYDGSAYFGFQLQPDRTTIQGELETALYKLTGETLRVKAAGRTDTGVHAKGQVVSFSTTSVYPVSQFVGALNFYLPDDIVVRTAAEVRPDFDARRSATRRHYRYYLLNRRSPSPFWRRYAFHVPARLDLASMKTAAGFLVGQHDFAAFAGREAKGRSTRREVLEERLEREGELITFDISADAFVAHQVRNMVGTLLWVGTGKLSVPEFIQVLAGRDRKAAGPAAPPHGLWFVKVDYPADIYVTEDHLQERRGETEL